MADFNVLLNSDPRYWMFDTSGGFDYEEILIPDKPFRVVTASEKMKSIESDDYVAAISHTIKSGCTSIVFVKDNRYNVKIENDITASFYQDTLVFSDYIDPKYINHIILRKSINSESEDKNNASN